ncbi:MAG: hypothetical protein SOH70_04060 [Lentilactobacillus sunkii]|jgi:hypothetical protein
MEQELIEILIALNGIDVSKKKEASEAMLTGATRLTELAHKVSK